MPSHANHLCFNIIVRLFFLITLFITLPSYSQPNKPQPFVFAALGDTPYSTREENIFRNVLERISDDQKNAFIIHVGDIKSGTESCADELLLSRKSLLEEARQPLILIPGDNEWTDCHRDKAGAFNPVERLQRLRDLFFSDDFPLGQEKEKLRLVRQSEQARFRQYRENVRWEYQGIQFVGLNLPGSNNNYRTDGGRNSEFEDRLQANRAWLQRAFHLAQQKRLRGLVILIQANPDFEGDSTSNKRDGYREFKQQLSKLVSEFSGHVLLIHGDSHRYQINQPLKWKNRSLKNFTRVEVFGSPFVSNWVRVKVEPSLQNVFVVETRDQ